MASFPTQVLSSRDGFLADTSFLSPRLLGWYLPRECRELPGEFTLVPGHEIFISTAAKRRKEIKDKQKGMGGEDIMLAAQHGTDKPMAESRSSLYQSSHHYVGPLVSMQSLIHCHGHCGHINIPRKCSQEKAVLEALAAWVGMHCNMHINKGHHVGLVVRDCSCLCQLWMVPGLQRISTWATPLRDNTREEPHPRATLARASWALWSHPVAGRRQMPTFLSGRKGCQDGRHISSNKKGQSGQEGGKFPLPRKDNQDILQPPVPSLSLPLRSTAAEQMLYSVSK